VVQMQPAHERVLVAEPALKGHGQVGDLLAEHALGQVGQHCSAPFPVDQLLDHRPPGLAERVGGHRAELDPGVLWRLLRAAVSERPDDLFIAGDTHQRIYGATVSLRSLGIRVAGRSFRLTINYRTTAEILGWSLGLLAGQRIDDMDEGLETLSGCRSDVHGSPPRTAAYATKAREMDELAARVRTWLDSGIAPAEVGVAARSNMLVDDAVAALKRVGIAAGSLAKSLPDDAVRVGTMHRMKGLEFRCVAVVGAGEHQIPMAGAVTPVEEDKAFHAAGMQRERCLIFVACTRAREDLYVSWHGHPSPFLTPLL
jgi:superfamily I DNA/RNA helicase